MEEKYIIVAYGDLIGYTDWVKNELNPREARDIFMDMFFDELGWFVLSSDFTVKYLGDGFMIVRELGKKGERVYDALRFLFGIHRLALRIHRLIKESDFSPAGFRIRVVAGGANKKLLPDPNTIDKKIAEYSSPAIDLSERLLYVDRDEIFVCHSSVVTLIGKKFKDLVFKKLKVRKYDPAKIKEDVLRELWTFQFKNGFHIT